MIDLVLVFCLSSTPRACVERRTNLASALPMACMVAGQMQAQAYLMDHPKYRLSRWRCELDLPHQQLA